MKKCFVDYLKRNYVGNDAALGDDERLAKLALLERFDPEWAHARLLEWGYWVAWQAWHAGVLSEEAVMREEEVEDEVLFVCVGCGRGYSHADEADRCPYCMP